MTDPGDRAPALGGSGRAVVIAGGVLLAVAVFLPWYWVPLAGGAGHVSGIALSAKAPELGILPALGLAAALAGMVLGRVPRPLRESVSGPGALAVGIVGLVVTLEVPIRLGGTLLSLYGTSFWGAAGLGWYLSMLGSFLILAAGVVRMALPAERFSAAAA